MEALLTETGIFHLLRQTRLLTLEHVAQKFVQFCLVFNWKLPGAKLLNQLVAIGNLLRSPAAGPAVRRVAKVMFAGILVLVTLALPTLLGRCSRRGFPGLSISTKDMGTRDIPEAGPLQLGHMTSGGLCGKLIHL